MSTDDGSAVEAGHGGTAPVVESGSPNQSGTPAQVAIGGGDVVLELPQRHAKILKLFESDVRTLERINRRAIAYFSISAFFVNIGIGVVVGFAFADPNSPLHPLGAFLWRFGPYVFFGLALILFSLGVWEWLIKHNEVDEIYLEHGLERRRFWHGVGISRLKRLGS